MTNQIPYFDTKRHISKRQMQGFYLMTAYWIDAAGARQSHDASTTDSKGLQCKRDGWAVEVGTRFLSITHCVVLGLDKRDIGVFV